MDSNFEDRSEQLPSVEEARMNMEASRRQSNSSLSKGSDIETAYSGSMDEDLPPFNRDHSLPSVDDVRMNSPRRKQSRCKVFLVGALVVVAAVVVTVALVITQTGTTEQSDEIPMIQSGSHQNSNVDVPTTDSPLSVTTETPTVDTTTTPPQQEEEETPPPTQAPASRYDQLVELLSSSGVSDTSDLIHPERPQNMAVNWLAEKDGSGVALDQPDAVIQRYIMATLFYAMGGNTWKNRLNFLSKEDVCNWYISGFAGDNKTLRRYGVTCNAAGVVTGIHFPSNFLSGSFPIEMSKLSNLERLDVFNNDRITGGFPEFLKGLTKMNFIGLHYCGLQGQLPTWLGSHTNLRSLVLSNNQFVGDLPSSMSQLTNLKDVYLDDNMFQGDISMLRGLSKLENLVIEDNLFQGELTDAMVGSWPELQVLDASHNMFQSSIPASVFSLGNLRVLDLHNNQFFGPMQVGTGTQPNLEVLTLNENDLSGSVPGGLSRFVNLKTLDLSNNKFGSTLPSSIGSLASLEYFFAAQNAFDAAEIPSFLSNMLSLKQLSLKGTKLIGNIPDWIGSLTNLVMLDLDNNALEGAIPPSLGSLTQLRYLLLNRNELEGSIPTTFESLTALAFFMIDQNKLTGSAEAVCKIPENVEMFIADCQAPAPEVTCSCCNVCCSDGNDQCNDNVWLGDSNPIWELGFDHAGAVEFDADASRSYKVEFTGAIP